MSAEDSDNKTWSDPKDYGLPFVEITPIRPKAEPEELITEDPLPEPVSIADPAEILDEPVVSETADDSIIFVENPEEHSERSVPLPPSENTDEKKKSKAWVWAVLVIAVGIVAVIVWQIQSRSNTAVEKQAFQIVERPVAENAAIVSDTSEESTATDQTQITVDQDSIGVPNISNPNISNPAESGTTIANTATGNLIRVESRAEKPQYFIIVGSLPNEKLALEEANQYFAKSAEIYLIEPFDGGKNYRLALSKFGSFRLASENLEEIKSQYTEELWILKY